MQTSRPFPAGVVFAPELTELACGAGPVATVYLHTEAQIDNAAQRSEQRWRHLRELLAGQGAPEAALAAVDPLIADAHLQGEALAVVAGNAGLLHAEHHAEPPRRELARWATLPSLAWMLEWRQASPPQVVVLADRLGADIMATGSHVPEIDTEAGDHDDARGRPVSRSAPGGWSQRRYQQRSENTWQHNAQEVAGTVVRLVDAVDARLIVVAGDVRARQLLREALPPHLQELLHEVEGSRSPDGSADELGREVRRLVATIVAEESVHVLERFKEERGRHERAADGVGTTLEALRAAQVDVLLVHDDPDDDRHVWIGPEPVHVASTPDEIRRMGVDQPVEARLVDAAVRAALGTSAGVRVVPASGGPRDGLGALLRWA